MSRPVAGDPERPHLRELLTEDLWERFLTAIWSLEQCQHRIDALTAQIETLRAALRDTRGEER
jgi:hypothetical protein